MRCVACDIALSDKESTRKLNSSNEYSDLCDDCFQLTYYDDIYADIQKDTRWDESDD